MDFTIMVRNGVAYKVDTVLQTSFKLYDCFPYLYRTDLVFRWKEWTSFLLKQMVR